MSEQEHQEMVIRGARGDDLAAVQRVAHGSLAWLGRREGWNDEQLASIQSSFDSAEDLEQLRARQTWLVAVLDGGVVGYASLAGGDLCQLHVNPAHHRQGIGTALFRAAERIAHDTGEAELRVRSNPTSVPFYQAMGMRVGGEVPWRDPLFAGRKLTALRKPLPDE
jgi:ribosomal protein S18 acetylase RimI-like enzyme